jgi:hypothetical protein
VLAAYTIAAQPTPPTVHIVDTQSRQSIPYPYDSVVQRLDSGGAVGYAPHGVSRQVRRPVEGAAN